MWLENWLYRWAWLCSAGAGRNIFVKKLQGVSINLAETLYLYYSSGALHMLTSIPNVKLDAMWNLAAADLPLQALLLLLLLHGAESFLEHAACNGRRSEVDKDLPEIASEMLASLCSGGPRLGLTTPILFAGRSRCVSTTISATLPLFVSKRCSLTSCHFVANMF